MTSYAEHNAAIQQILAPIKEYDAVLRFVRTDWDGVTHTREHVVRFPCTADFEQAEMSATRIAYAIVEGLPQINGWKMARDCVGTITEVEA